MALSAHGDTALIGGPEDDQAEGFEGLCHNPRCHGKGAAWVFTRSRSTWTQQAKLIVDDIGARFGASVALSADGESALIGTTRGNTAWVFTRSGSTWNEQAEPTAPAECGSFAEFGECGFGESVSLSGDGNTALIGGPYTNAENGAA